MKRYKSISYTESGYVELIRYESESCEGYPVKQKCTKSKGNKQMELSRPFLNLQAESTANIALAKGMLLRMNRSIQVEGAFGAIKEDHGFRRFSLGNNINKLCNKIQNDRCGCLLHKKEIA